MCRIFSSARKGKIKFNKQLNSSCTSCLNYFALLIKKLFVSSWWNPSVSLINFIHLSPQTTAIDYKRSLLEAKWVKYAWLWLVPSVSPHLFYDSWNAFWIFVRQFSDQLEVSERLALMSSLSQKLAYYHADLQCYMLVVL